MGQACEEIDTTSSSSTSTRARLTDTTGSGLGCNQLGRRRRRRRRSSKPEPDRSRQEEEGEGEGEGEEEEEEEGEEEEGEEEGEEGAEQGRLSETELHRLRATLLRGQTSRSGSGTHHYVLQPPQVGQNTNSSDLVVAFAKTVQLHAAAAHGLCSSRGCNHRRGQGHQPTVA